MYPYNKNVVILQDHNSYIILWLELKLNFGMKL